MSRGDYKEFSEKLDENSLLGLPSQQKKVYPCVKSEEEARKLREEMAPWDELCGSQMVKCLPAVWEAWVPSLGREDPLEEGRATHSSILAWRTPWTEVGYSPWGRKELDTSE